VTLLRLGKIYEKKGDLLLALSIRQLLKSSDGIYIDEALYFRRNFQQQLPAKNHLYEKIIFSLKTVFFVEARKSSAIAW
jgi:hypothetical protein